MVGIAFHTRHVLEAGADAPKHESGLYLPRMEFFAEDSVLFHADREVYKAAVNDYIAERDAAAVASDTTETNAP